MGFHAVCTYTGGDAPRLVGVFWGRSTHAVLTVVCSFRVIGGAAVTLIIMGAGPTSWGWFAVPHCHAHFRGFM